LDLALLLGAAAVVGVLGLQPLEVVEQLRLECFHPVCSRGVLGGGIRVLRRTEDVVDGELVVCCGLSVLRDGAGGLCLRPLLARTDLVAVGLFEVLVSHGYFFSSSSSMTSASTTSSSELVVASPSAGWSAGASGAVCEAWFEA